MSDQAQQVIDAAREVIERFLQDGREEFRQKLVEFEPLIATFIATGDAEQLAVVQHRLQTWARRQAFDAIRAQNEAISAGFVQVIRIAVQAA